MSWPAAYRLALRLLPVGLRRKHGPAMEILFARELGRARERGTLAGVVAGAEGLWDVVRRGAYEQLRAGHGGLDAQADARPESTWHMNARTSLAAGAHFGDSFMPQPTTGELLRRHAVSFAAAFALLTLGMLALFARRQVPALAARGEPAAAIAEMLLLAIPFIAAMTIPMAVLVAVLREFTRLRADGTLTAARRERGGVRRLVVPVLGAAAGVAALALVVTAGIVPRTNARLASVLVGRAVPPSDRTMTIGELREAARRAEAAVTPVSREQAAGYELEIQKKLALPAACVVLALVGIAVALHVPRGGMALVLGATVVVLGAYYVLIVTGEQLADRQVVSPFVAMWGANLLLLAAALLAVRRRRAPDAPGGSGAVAIGG